VSTTLYTLAVSHPGHSARLMLEHKGIEHKVVEFLPGMQPLPLHALGFRRGTVPALRADGRRVQGTRTISRYLESVQPEPSLFGADPGERAAIEETERWGEEELQPVPRQLGRWLAANRAEMRVMMATDNGMPAPALISPLMQPLAAYFARKSGASREQDVREAVGRVAPMLDRVEWLIEEGVIGGSEMNAADFQIAPSLRLLIAFDDVAPLIERRKAGRYALSLMPTYPMSVPQGLVPQPWLEPLAA
jgi:glutathione S-transferase